MKLKWTSKALSDLVRLNDFLSPVNKLAAAHMVQSLSSARHRFLEQPRVGEKLQEFEPREVRRITMNCAMKLQNQSSMCYCSGIREKIDNL